MPKRRPKKLEVRVNKTTGKVKKALVLESNEDMEQEKLMLMKVGVACIMVILVVAWIFNLKYQFKINSENSGKSSFDWQQTKAQLDQAMGQVKQGLDQIKQAREQVRNTLPKQPAFVPSSGRGELTAEQIDLLKGKLISNASSTVASSTSK